MKQKPDSERHFNDAMQAKVARMQNLKFAQAIYEELESRRLTATMRMIGSQEDAEPLGLQRGQRLVQDVRWCGKSALWAEHSDGGLRLVSEHVCRNKFCLRCNSIRKKLIRAKYLSYFKLHPGIRTGYDFMHLTLTVRHTASGWRGREVYGDLLLAEFNKLRRFPWWKDLVHAGEYTVEHTRGEHGWHCHIHALVLVKKAPGSRNELHRKILLAWNRATVDSNLDRTAWTEEQVDGLRRSLGYLDQEKADSVIGALNPRGSTMIGLESLYYFIKTRKGARKIYSKPEDDESFIKGILECLKYHFEPIAFKDDQGGWNAGLILDASELLYKKRLYGKFGAFYGLKDLNLNERLEDVLIEHLEETIEDGTIERYVIAKPSQVTQRAGKTERDYTTLYLRGFVRILEVVSYHDALSEFREHLIHKKRL